MVKISKIMIKAEFLFFSCYFIRFSSISLVIKQLIFDLWLAKNQKENFVWISLYLFSRMLFEIEISIHKTKKGLNKTEKLKKILLPDPDMKLILLLH